MPPEPFEYAVLRVVPRVERGEGVNVGVVVLRRKRSEKGASKERG